LFAVPGLADIRSSGLAWSNLKEQTVSRQDKNNVGLAPGSFGRRETHFPPGEIVFSSGKNFWHVPKLFSQPEKTFRRMENVFSGLP
jgi:hypothetical protein